MEDGTQNIKTAVIYYCYNRLDHTKKSLTKVIKYRKELPLYIYCDGPKKAEGFEVLKVREFVKEVSFDLDKTTIIFRDENLGLAPNVINGVNEVFSKGHDAVVVLEDDCVPKKGFFNFMTTALSFYKNHNSVMHVSAFGLPLKNKSKEDFYIVPFPCSWGWGTWKNKWMECDFEDIEFYDDVLSETSLKAQFDWAGKSFSYFLELQLNEKINSWLVRWYAHIFKNKGVCVWATNSELENIGFDGTGVHKVRLDRFNQKGIEEKESFEFKNDLNFDLKVIKEFRQVFMGRKTSDKIKTVIYMYTGVIIDKFKDRSNYYIK